MRSRSIAVVLGACALLAPSIARAERPDLAHGRGLVWGASGAIPILIGDLRYAPSGAADSYVPLGGGVDAHVGVELDSGFRLELAAGADGHFVQGQFPLARYRIGAQARMPIELGGNVYPFFGLGGALALFSRNASLAATFDVRGLAGVGWWLAQWFALEVSVAVDVTAPGFAFVDTMVIVTPLLGVDVSF